MNNMPYRIYDNEGKLIATARTLENASKAVKRHKKINRKENVTYEIRQFQWGKK